MNGFYTKTDKQIDNYYEVVAINKSLPMQYFSSKTLVLELFIFNVFLIIGKSFRYTNHYQRENFRFIVFCLHFVCDS